MTGNAKSIGSGSEQVEQAQWCSMTLVADAVITEALAMQGVMTSGEIKKYIDGNNEPVTAANNQQQQ